MLKDKIRTNTVLQILIGFICDSRIRLQPAFIMTQNHVPLAHIYSKRQKNHMQKMEVETALLVRTWVCPI